MKMSRLQPDPREKLASILHFACTRAGIDFDVNLMSLAVHSMHLFVSLVAFGRSRSATML